MDFSCLQLDDFLGQDLVIVLLLPATNKPTTGSNALPEIETRYYHIIGEKGISNDKNFVFSAFIQLYEMLAFKKPRIVIYSDGGPKHFKVSAVLFGMSILSQIMKFQLRWSFFAPNHGSHIYDGVASHAKKDLFTYAIDNKFIYSSAKDIVTVLNKSPLRNAFILNQRKWTFPDTEVDTIQNIRKLYFCFVVNDGKVKAWTTTQAWRTGQPHTTFTTFNYCSLVETFMNGLTGSSFAKLVNDFQSAFQQIKSSAPQPPIKRTYSCSNCKQPGHTIKKCPHPRVNS